MATGIANSGVARPAFIDAYLKELPKVAAGLTTALIIFLASVLLFPPVHAFFFGTKAKGYPIICKLEPVKETRRPPGDMEVDLFVINTSAKDLTGTDLRSQLDAALEGTGRKGDPRIMLQRPPGYADIIDARIDTEFNAGKGELSAMFGPQSVVVTIARIDAASVLRAKLIVADDQPRTYTRAQTPALPFLQGSLAELAQSCFARDRVDLRGMKPAQPL